MGRGDCNHCGEHIADWPEDWGVDVTLYCPKCWRTRMLKRGDGA